MRCTYKIDHRRAQMDIEIQVDPSLNMIYLLFNMFLVFFL